MDVLFCFVMAAWLFMSAKTGTEHGSSDKFLYGLSVVMIIMAVYNLVL